MPYVQRDGAGKVIGRFANKQIGYAEEFLDDGHADLDDPPQAKIVQIEQSNPITHRALRELILTLGEAFPDGKNTVFYQRVLATEQAILVERAKL